MYFVNVDELEYRQKRDRVYVKSLTGTVTVAGHRKVLGAGDGYVIPGNVRHGFRVVSAEPAEYIEVFSPPKDSNR
jgi:mannose-6-phosphate isomerase-like protein (cupin superfamily)